MRVDRITLTHVCVPLVSPLRASSGEVSEKDAILVQVHAEGLIGTGEASPMAGTFYSEDTPASVWKYLADRLIPAAFAARAGSVPEINRILARSGGSPFARAGLETAFWDLEARRDGKPLFALLGGARVPLASTLSVGITRGIPELLAAIEKHLADGYRCVKIQIQPGWDIGPLSEIRQRFGDISLAADAGGAYGRESISHLRSLDAFALVMIEQPLPGSDPAGNAELQAQIRTPLCFDEGAEDLPSLQRAIRMKSCRMVNIMIQRVGGLAAAKAMHDLCERAGIPAWAGTMPELGIGGAHALHLATLPGFAAPMEVGSSLRWCIDDIIDPYICVEKGVVTIPEGEGICYAPAGRTIERYRLAERVFLP